MQADISTETIGVHTSKLRNTKTLLENNWENSHPADMHDQKNTKVHCSGLWEMILKHKLLRIKGFINTEK